MLVRHIGQPLSMDATMSVQLAQKSDRLHEPHQHAVESDRLHNLSLSDVSARRVGGNRGVRGVDTSNDVEHMSLAAVAA